MDNLDTNWFRVSSYARFKDMPLVDWYSELNARAKIDLSIKLLLISVDGENEETYLTNTLESALEKLKTGYEFRKDYRISSLVVSERDYMLENAPFSFPLGRGKRVVTSLPAYEVEDLYTLKDMQDVWEECRMFWGAASVQPQDRLQPPTTTLSIDTPFQPVDDFLYDRYEGNDHFARMVVDLDANDKQIMTDFKDLLAKYRKDRKEQHFRKMFCDADRSKWHRYGVIQYLDLMLISKIEKKRMPQNVIANLIFKDEDGIDFTERVRKVVKPMSEKLIHCSSLNAMKRQVDLATD